MVGLRTTIFSVVGLDGKGFILMKMTTIDYGVGLISATTVTQLQVGMLFAALLWPVKVVQIYLGSNARSSSMCALR